MCRAVMPSCNQGLAADKNQDLQNLWKIQIFKTHDRHKNIPFHHLLAVPATGRIQPG